MILKSFGLAFGPVMWRCTNGRPNHATEWCVSLTTYTTPPGCHVAVTPFLYFGPWRKSTLATDPSLGVQSSCVTFGIEWWAWSIGFLVSRTRNTKTQAQIDAGRKEGV